MTLLIRSAPRIAVLVVVAVLAAAGSAGAVSMITGRKIKDGSLTSVDLRNGSLQSIDVLDGAITGGDVRDGALVEADLDAPAKDALRGAQGVAGAVGVPGIRGYRLVQNSVLVGAGQSGSVRADCPADLPTVLSVQGLFALSNDAVSTSIPSASTGIALGHNFLAQSQVLTVQVVCALVQ